MKPTEILSQEHRVIEQVLACLEKIVENATLDRKLDGQAARDAIEFFRAFADRCHHGKEEARLFPAMEAKGFSPECGPTAVMRAEHDLGRLRVREMEAAIDAAAAGQKEAIDRFTGHARAYVELLRQHIQKEDHCLFAMADQALSEAEQAGLLAAFEKVESDQMQPGTHESYLRLADALAERLGIPRAATAQGSGQVCGH
ncbi:MAG: hemerythrin domain-containing protein [Thermoguttaceae bacterium]